MGHESNYEYWALRWTEACADQVIRDLPGKVEINALGVIEMSPASTRHGRLQMLVGMALETQLGEGAAFSECPIVTAKGLRVPDVAWASPAFLARYGDMSPFPAAPDICVEVRSPANTDDEMEFKTALFLAAGAVEVWIVATDGTRRVFDAGGEQPDSRYPVKLPAA